MAWQLWPHQQAAIQRMKDKNGFALYHEMGAGKTFTTICDINPRLISDDVSRVLIICPLSVIPTWINQIAQNTPFKAQAVRGTPMMRRRVLRGGARILVINYDLLHAHLDELLDGGFDYIVADESQRLINPGVLWTKAALKLAAQAKWRRVLTGTPIRKFELDLYNQMRFIDPDILPWRSHFAFRKQFAIELNRGGFSQIIGVRDADQIKERCAPFCDYVSFDEAVPGMPAWVDLQRVVPMNAEQARVYKELKRDLLVQINGQEITAQNAAVLLGRLAQVSGGTLKDHDGAPHILGSHKLAEVDEIISETRGQVIIWCRFRAECEWLADKLHAPFIHGGVSPSHRQVLLTEFRQRVHRILVCQLDTLSEGVNELSNADVEIRWSYDWSYLSYSQSRARMRRANRTNPNPCRSIHLVTEGGTDERIIDAVLKKRNVAISTLEDIRSILQ